VADSNNYRIQKFTSGGPSSQMGFLPGPQRAVQQSARGAVDSPTCVCGDAGAIACQKFDSNGNCYLTQWGCSGPQWDSAALGPGGGWRRQRLCGGYGQQPRPEVRSLKKRRARLLQLYLGFGGIPRKRSYRAPTVAGPENFTRANQPAVYPKTLSPLEASNEVRIPGFFHFG